MEEKLIIDKDLFNELTTMMQSPSVDDAVMAISILESSDQWDRQNQKYKEQLYITFRENKHFGGETKNGIKMKAWMGVYEVDHYELKKQISDALNDLS